MPSFHGVDRVHVARSFFLGFPLAIHAGGGTLGGGMKSDYTSRSIMSLARRSCPKR